SSELWTPPEPSVSAPCERAIQTPAATITRATARTMPICWTRPCPGSLVPVSGVVLEDEDTDVGMNLGATVGVEAVEEVVAVVGEDDRGETEQQDDGAASSAPATECAGVQVDAVDQPGEESCGLLRVPRPVDTPRVVRPDRAEDQDEREQGEPDTDGAKGNV